MEINGLPPALLTPRLSAASISNWQVGQLLQAVVVKQETPNSVILQIANQQLQAETNIPLTNGQRLQLTVVQLGEKPLLQASLLGTSNTNETTASGAMTAKQNGSINQPALQARDNMAVAQNTLLKQALPKQASMAGLLANITWLNSAQGRTSPIPPAILDLAKQIYNQSLDKVRLSEPQLLKQGILDSGIFLENKLSTLPAKPTDQSVKQLLKEAVALTMGKAQTPDAAGIEKSGGDLKAQLLRLLGTIQQISRITPGQTSQAQANSAVPAETLPSQTYTPPTLRGNPPQPQAKAEATLANLNNQQLLLLELGKQTEAALARTHLHQAASLPTGDQTANLLAFELPIRNNQQLDLFDVVIEHEANKDDDDQESKHRWSVTLAFDLDGLGPVYAKLQLVDNKVSTLFWSENTETTRLFNEHMAELLQRYRQSGIEASDLHCYQGPPPESPGKRLPRIVLDVNA